MRDSASRFGKKKKKKRKKRKKKRVCVCVPHTLFFFPHSRLAPFPFLLVCACVSLASPPRVQSPVEFHL